MCVERNIVARLRTHCCHGKAVLHICVSKRARVAFVRASGCVCGCGGSSSFSYIA
jgi:hypothetical protein